MASVLVAVVVLTATRCVVDGRPVPDGLPTAAELGLDPGGGLRYSPIGNVGDRAILQVCPLEVGG